jgi:hypothetical protein
MIFTVQIESGHYTEESGRAHFELLKDIGKL